MSIELKKMVSLFLMLWKEGFITEDEYREAVRLAIELYDNKEK